MKAPRRSALVLASVTLLLAGCPAAQRHDSTGTRAPSVIASPGSTSPDAEGPTDPSLPTDPIEIYARNIHQAALACATCEGQREINLDPTAREAAVAKQIGDSNKDFRLTRTNAELALRGPVGSTPTVAGRGVQGGDVIFRNANGTVVFRREVKCLTGFGNFSDEMSRAAKQVEYDGEVFVQVPTGTDLRAVINKFWGPRTDDDLSKYRYVWVVFHQPDGKPLGVYMLGLRGMSA
jgi:hypothetical protein